MSAEQTIRQRLPHVMKIDGKEFNCKTSYHVRIGNINIYQDLIELGLCPRKSLVVKLPVIPKQYFNFFLRGYFDGDGCINIEKSIRRLRIIFTSGSRDFLDQMGTEIGLLVGTPKIGIYFNHRAYKLTYGNKIAERLASLIYKDIDEAPFLKYKHDKYVEYLNDKKQV